MHVKTLGRLHADFDPGPVYSGLYNARRPLTSDNFTLGMKREVEGLRMELLLAELPPPQYDLPPRARQSPVLPPP